MQEFTVGQAQKLTAPAPFALISTKDTEHTNLMACSWWTYLSNHPAKLGICLKTTGHSGSLIRKNGEFAVNVVGEELKECASLCGTVSGSKEYKADKFGITLTDAMVISPQVVENSKVIFECRCTDTVEAGDHTFYIADILKIYGNEEVKALYAYDGYGRLDTV